MNYTPDESVQLHNYTTLQIGGPAEYFYRVHDSAELPELCTWAVKQNLPITILGGGSNVLVSDAGVEGLVLQIVTQGREVRHVDADTVLATYAAGTVFDEVVADTVAEGWWGLENLSHIPGTVGATPVQNVGAYGVEVADCITTVRVFDTEKNIFQELPATACDFSYRNSLFKQPAGRRYIVTDVTFALTKTPQPRLEYADLQSLVEQDDCTQAAIRQRVIAVRSGKFPDWHQVGTAGSFFKNPVITAEHYSRLLKQYPELPAHQLSETSYKIPLGWVLDKLCALKGYTVGPVGTHEAQALVLVNHGGATAVMVQAFAAQVAELVYEKTGIEIEWEVTPVGVSV